MQRYRPPWNEDDRSVILLLTTPAGASTPRWVLLNDAMTTLPSGTLWVQIAKCTDGRSRIDISL
jgi:hypothetical protein